MADEEVSRVPVCHDVPKHRCNGKQPIKQNGRPTGAVRGESEPSSRPALHRVQHEDDWECGDCGFKQVRSLRQCAFCKAESGGAEEDQNVIEKIRELNEEEHVYGHVLKGMQQFLLGHWCSIYGLRESPEDWTQHRNSKMRVMKWMLHNRMLHLEQTAEANLWAICADQEVLGFVGTYVDDIVTVGDVEVVESALDVFAKTWECSLKEMLSQEGQQLKFCGFQVRRLCNGYHLHQHDYIRDLCERRGISGGHRARGSLVTVQEEPDENYSIESLRQAQQVIGEIQWLSTRSRPDITYAVGLLSRFMHRCPDMVVKQANNILKYLADTAEKGLVYEQCCSEDIFGAEGELKFPTGLHHVEAHGDASYAPSLENYRSVQGTVVSVAGCPIIWSSTRQRW